MDLPGSLHLALSLPRQSPEEPGPGRGSVAKQVATVTTEAQTPAASSRRPLCWGGSSHQPPARVPGGGGDRQGVAWRESSPNHRGTPHGDCRRTRLVLGGPSAPGAGRAAVHRGREPEHRQICSPALQRSPSPRWAFLDAASGLRTEPRRTHLVSAPMSAAQMDINGHANLIITKR